MKIKTKILKTIKKDVDKFRKKTKIKRRPYPIWSSYTFTSPKAVYAAGALHYVAKNGRVKHSNKSVAEVKKDTMSISEFKKKYYDPIKSEKNYLKKYD